MAVFWPWMPLSQSAQSNLAVQARRPGVRFSGKAQVLFEPYAHSILLNGFAEFGETKLAAERIDYYPDGAPAANGRAAIEAGTCIAHGSVILTDPVGQVSATDLTFNVSTVAGSARAVSIRLEGMLLRAESIRIQPRLWTLDQVSAQLISELKLVELQGDRITIRPGDTATVVGAKLRFAGRTILGWPKYATHLNAKQVGSFLPIPTYDGNLGFGLRYQPSYLIQSSTILNGNFTFNQSQLPSYSLHASHSFVQEPELSVIPSARSDLNFRFDWSYFDQVSTPSMDNERTYLTRPMSVLTAGVAYNVQALDRRKQEEFVRPFEVDYQQTFRLPAEFGLMSELGYQEVRQVGDANQLRYIGSGTLLAPSLRLGAGLMTDMRLDGEAYEGSDDRYGWVRAQAGLVKELSSSLTLGLAGYQSAQRGSPLYVADELYSMRGWDIRADWHLGPRRFSAIFKLDAGTGTWYDREFSFAQALGPVEAFVQLRTFPSSLIFGVQVRPDSLLQQLQKRLPGK